MLTVDHVQRLIEARSSEHPEWHKEDAQFFENMKKEQQEIQEALNLCKEGWSIAEKLERMEKFKATVGGSLFTVICLLNKYEISLVECVELMLEKRREKKDSQH